MDPTIHLGNVRTRHPRISRDTVLKPSTERKREGKKSLICPHVMIFDWWFTKFYLLSLPVLSFQKWPLSSPCDCVIHEELRVNCILSPIYSLKLHFDPYTFPFHLSRMPPRSSNTVLEEWRPTIIFSHFFWCPFLSIVFSIKSPFSQHFLEICFFFTIWWWTLRVSQTPRVRLLSL